MDNPHSELRVLHELTQNKMADVAESDIAIRFVDEKDYKEISAKAVSVKRKLKRNFWFDIYFFISLLLFNKNNTWRPICFIVQTTSFNRPAKFLILLKH